MALQAKYSLEQFYIASHSTNALNEIFFVDQMEKSSSILFAVVN